MCRNLKRKQNADSVQSPSPALCSLWLPGLRAFAARTSYLLAEGAVAALPLAVQLVRLPQQRVEGLSRAVHGGGVGGHAEGRHVAHLLQRVVTLRSFVQQLVILQILRQTLQHGNGLIEVHLEET